MQTYVWSVIGSKVKMGHVAGIYLLFFKLSEC